MNYKIKDIDVAKQIGAYSDSVITHANLRWFMTSGTPGLQTDGKLPTDIAGQAELAWKHILKMLDKAGMTVAGIVNVTQHLTRAEDIPPTRRCGRKCLATCDRRFMLLVVNQFVWPEIHVEVEVITAKA